MTNPTLKIITSSKVILYLKILPLILIAYSALIVLPAFNADDIIQGQLASNDPLTFLASGRWGYYLIYSKLTFGQPAPIFSTILGCSLICASAILATHILEIEDKLATTLFTLCGSVSLYYTEFLSFDSTQIAYPLSMLFATLGVNAKKPSHLIPCAFAITLSLSLFQASIQLSIVITILFAITQIQTNQKWLNSFSKKFFSIFAGALIYIATTHFSETISGIPLSTRTEINIASAITNHTEILRLFTNNSWPKGKDLYYYAPIIQWVLVISFITWAILILKSDQIQRQNKAKIFLLVAALLFAPFSLALVSTESINTRALLAYPFIHAFFISIVIKLSQSTTDRTRAWLNTAALCGAAILVLISAIKISNQAQDSYISSRNDILATNRIIYSIDQHLSKINASPESEIPLHVFYQQPISMAPNGPASTNRAAPWSKEWIFRSVDPRFKPVLTIDTELLKTEIENRQPWPHESSIFFLEKTLIIYIN